MPSGAANCGPSAPSSTGRSGAPSPTLAASRPRKNHSPTAPSSPIPNTITVRPTVLESTVNACPRDQRVPDCAFGWTVAWSLSPVRKVTRPPAGTPFCWISRAADSANCDDVHGMLEPTRPAEQVAQGANGTLPDRLACGIGTPKPCTTGQLTSRPSVESATTLSTV